MASGTVDRKPSVLERLNLTWVLRLLSSSIGRKVVMAITGLGLSLFLVAHLAGNLNLYRGKDAFDNYAHKLHEQEWLPLAEAALFLAFLVHIYLAFVTTAENRRARQQAYALRQSKRTDITFPVGAPASSWMFVSGAAILGFLILHIVDMKLQLRPDVVYAGEHESYLNTFAVLSNPISQIVYLLGTIFLGFHLSHGVASAFQSLGLSHPKYTPTIKWAGVIFAIVIAAGFFSLPAIVPNMPDRIQEAQDGRAALQSETPEEPQPSAAH